MPTPRHAFALLAAIVSCASPVWADDWPQWRGPGRLAIWHETGIIDRFPDNGVRIVWRVPVGSGFAGPAVAGGRVFVLDWHPDLESRMLEGTERLVALDEATGDVLWIDTWPATYGSLQSSYATGPRATPTVDGDRVYAVGASGTLRCLDAVSGALVWQKHYPEDFATAVPPFGIASAPLVDGDRLIAVVGGDPGALVVAFDKHTGEELWRAVEVVGEMGYGQPVIYEAGGVRQLIVWHASALVSLDPDTGSVYWEQPWDVGLGMSVATPVNDGNYLLVSQFYSGSMMMRLQTDRPAATVIWQGASRSELPGDTDGLHSLMTTPIVSGDYVYGVGSYGELRALNARTGERLWMSDRLTAQARFGTAHLVRQGDRYFATIDSGELVIARLTPEGYDEVDRTALIEPTSSPGYGPGGRLGRQDRVSWSHPAYANRHIVHRNDKEVLRASLALSDYREDR